MTRFTLCLLATTLLGPTAAFAGQSGTTLPAGGDVGNLGWITPQDGAHEKAGGLPFVPRLALQLSTGKIDLQYKSAYGGGPVEAAKIVDLGIEAGGAHELPLGNGVIGELGGIFGVNLDWLHVDDARYSYSYWTGSSYVTSTYVDPGYDGARAAVSLAPEVAVRVRVGERGYVRPAVSFGPMGTYRTSFNQGGSNARFDFGTTLRFGIEAGAKSVPVVIGLGHQRFNYKPEYGEYIEVHDGMTFLTFRVALN